MTDNPSRSIKTTDTIITIITALQELDGATLSEMDDYLDLAKSTIHGHLKTLEEKGYVVYENDTYHVGLRFLEHGMYAKNRLQVHEVAHDSLVHLAEETKDSAWLIVEEHGRAINLDKVLGEYAIEQLGGIVGRRTYLHEHAAGKAILAQMPRQKVEAVIDKHGLPARTEHTITDRDELFDELDAIREQGYAFMENESINNVRSVGAPIMSDDGVVGAISVAGPANRLNGEYYRTDLPEMILASTNEVELRLSYK